MQLFLYLLTLVLVAYHLHTRQVPPVRRIVAYFIAVSAVCAFWAGFHIAITEDALGRYGEVVPGKVGERISSTGEHGTTTFGALSPTVVVANQGGEFYDFLERLIATGSGKAWAISFNYPCDSAFRCWGRAFVSHQRWLQMGAGDAVKVRYAKGTLGGARLDDEPQWATAIARMAIGIGLLAAAVLIWDSVGVSAAAASRGSEQPAYPPELDRRRRYMA